MGRKKRSGNRGGRAPFRFLNHLLGVVPRNDPGFEPLNAATAFQVQNVADYYFYGTDQEWWDEGKDFPNIAPPMPLMWFEYELPETVWSEGKVIVATDRPRLRYGFLVHAIDFEDPEQVALAPPRTRKDVERLRETSEIRWLCSVQCYLNIPGREFHHDSSTPITFTYFVGRDGALHSPANKVEGRFAAVVRWREGDPVEKLPEEERQGVVEEWFRSTITSYHTVLLALSFMHCRNVHRRVEPDPWAPPPITPGQKPTRRQRQPRKTYHILEIEAMKEVVSSAGGPATEGGRKALHICRGHFKTYEQKGLFGNPRLRGTWWWPMHLRGAKGRGFVDKDYEVHP